LKLYVREEEEQSMSFLQSFRPECVQLGTTARNKEEVLADIARIAKRSNLLKAFSEQQILSALQERERIGSTGFAPGIAIPHCTLEGLEEFVIGLLVVPGGVDFQALEGGKTDIFFFILGPSSGRHQHIQFLSAISRVFKDPHAVSRFTRARGKEGILQAVEEFFGAIQIFEAGRQKNRCLFHVFIQREEYFDEVLQVFSTVAHGNVNVLETRGAGDYLYRMPLFAAYWTEGHRGFSRMLVAVVDKDLCNEVMRRIGTIVEDGQRQQGLMVVAQDLFFTSGSLEL
jgi:mannitol/fructose-specific phosphotransferase system IIA component (Ntr-type)